MKQVVNKRKPKRVLTWGYKGYGHYERILVKVVSFEKETVFNTQFKYRIVVVVSNNSYYYGKLSKTWIFGTDDKFKIGEELKCKISMF